MRLLQTSTVSKYEFPWYYLFFFNKKRPFPSLGKGLRGSRTEIV
ncbi:hypothetical protein HMPREF1869_00080 [Bacteroidales bacterium KA00251]|nr:hypothetical protein HMPREF1869_00080 [Bacteroidales bacterium KA00251]